MSDQEKEDKGINQKLLESLKDVVEIEAWHSLGSADELKEKPIRRFG